MGDRRCYRAKGDGSISRVSVRDEFETFMAYRAVAPRVPGQPRVELGTFESYKLAEKAIADWKRINGLAAQDARKESA